MLAKKNPIVTEAAKTIYRVSAEDQARRLCEAAERYESEQNTFKDIIAQKDSLLIEKDAMLSEQAEEIAALKAQLMAFTQTKNS